MYQLISWMYCVYFNEAQEVFRKYFFLNIKFFFLKYFLYTAFFILYHTRYICV